MSIPTPVEISDVEAAFPAHALDWMPDYEEIPEDFRYGNDWTKFVNTWFSYGLSRNFSFQPAKVDGELIDAPKAFRQLAAIMGSFQPKHEHKVAAVAYLSSLWMESMIYAKPDTPLEEHTALGEASLEDWLEVMKQREDQADGD